MFNRNGSSIILDTTGEVIRGYRSKKRLLIKTSNRNSSLIIFDAIEEVIKGYRS